jgi:acyl-coenzyme A thioesterase PaaI-like protein
MGGTRDYRTPVSDVLRRGLVPRGNRFTLTLDPAFQGLPDTAHGGSVLAALDLATAIAGRRRLGGTYRRRVPLGVPLLLAPVDGAAGAYTLEDDHGVTLVDGRVVADGSARADGDAPAPLPGGHPLPLSSSCFACGLENPIGLRVALRFDDDVVGGSWKPHDGFASATGRLAPIALTTLLDEAAFWLGALASGESGMTTQLDIAVHTDVAPGTPVHVVGRRAAVRRHPDDARYWDTQVTAHEDSGRLIGEGRITFVAVRGAARRLVAGLARTNPTEVLRRVFPDYTT